MSSFANSQVSFRTVDKATLQKPVAIQKYQDHARLQDCCV